LTHSLLAIQLSAYSEPQGQYQPFDIVTRRALHHAVKEVGEAIDEAFEDELMKQYDALDTFSDVDSALQKLVVPLTESNKVKPVIFSNGTHSMAAESIAGSDLLNKTKLFDRKQDLVLIDEISTEKRKYKPDPITYSWLCDNLGPFGVEKENIWLITANPFDVDGAKRYGLKVCWVNRAGGEWIDGIGEPADYMCKDVGECICKILQVEKVPETDGMIESFLKS
jgi:2-haloacid dehalogenase